MGKKKTKNCHIDIFNITS